MKHLLRNLGWGIFFLIAAANVYIFVAGMQISTEINKFEIETARMKNENTLLERQITQAQSLEHAKQMSKRLNFTKKSLPVYFENLTVALAR